MESKSSQTTSSLIRKLAKVRFYKPPMDTDLRVRRNAKMVNNGNLQCYNLISCFFEKFLPMAKRMKKSHAKTLRPKDKVNSSMDRKNLGSYTNFKKV